MHCLAHLLVGGLMQVKASRWACRWACRWVGRVAGLVLLLVTGLTLVGHLGVVAAHGWPPLQLCLTTKCH